MSGYFGNGYGNPGVWGTAGSGSRLTGNPGVWGTAKTTKKAAPKTTNAAASVNSGYDPYASAMTQADMMIQTLLADVQRQQDAARAQAMQEAALEAEKGRALAYGLQQLGIADTVNKIFQSAGANQANLAQGFSGQIRDQAAAQAAQQQQALLGTGQEGAVRNQGENMGNVIYGLGGSIPGTELSTLGAAFGAQAALEPGFATQFGEINAAKRRQEWASELAKWAERKAEILGQKPDYFYKALDTLLGDSGTSSSSQSKLTSRTLANGQVQWYDPYTGKPVGKPTGPARSKSKTSSDAPNLQAKRLANGQYVAFDPATGKTQGKPWGPVTKKGSGASSSGTGTYSLQMKDMGTYKQAWDPRTGKFVGPRYPKPKDAATAKERPDGMTSTQVRKARTDAYTIAKGWSDNGMKDADGNPVKAQDLLKEMMNEGGIPFDIAVRQLAKFFKPARKWFKNNPTQQAAATTTGKGIQIPVSYTGTHVSDGLGWGTNTAQDIMGAPGTPVLAPESGTVVYFHPTGAQGGGSMLIRTDSGKEYWLGHIDNGMRAGRRVRKGQKVAVISADHPRPHVHVDSRVYV